MTAVQGGDQFLDGIGETSLVARYTFNEAWVSKYKGGELNATSNNLAIEEVTIVHEGLVRVK